MSFMEFKTVEPGGTGMDIDCVRVESSCKIPSSAKLIRVDKGYWSNRDQDWFARLTFDNGSVVNSGYLFSRDYPVQKVEPAKEAENCGKCGTELREKVVRLSNGHEVTRFKDCPKCDLLSSNRTQSDTEETDK